MSDEQNDYGDQIPVTTLVKRMCEQSFTQYGGARPHGTALLIAGVDSRESTLFEKIRPAPISHTTLAP